MIQHDNIIYIRNINSIGGVETYAYELVKKYKDNDIAVVCKTIAPKQKERLNKFCKVYIHKEQSIKCKVIITNWDTSIIKYINKEAKVYTGLHTDYSHPSQGSVPQDDERITYIGITEDSKNKFENITGIKRTILCRNPLEIEDDEPVLILMSATRLTEEKGGARMLALANKLDELGIKYIWYIFTTNEYKDNPVWKNENIIHMNNRLDLGYFMKQADWYIQFSEVEGDSYSLKEALYRNIPIVVCELPYFKEIGIKDGVNALFLNLDSSNVEDVAKRMQKPLKFKFEHINDGYDEIIVKGKSRYEEERNMKYLVEALDTYEKDNLSDGELKRIPKEGEQFEVTKERLDVLLGDNEYNKVFVKLIKPIEEKKIEKAVKPKDKVEKATVKNGKSK